MLEYIEMSDSHYDESYEIWKLSDGVDLTLGDSREAVNVYLNHNPGMSFICKDNGKDKIVGTILCGHDGRRGYIYHLAVLDEYRGKGIAKELIQLSFTKLKDEGIERCIIMVKDFNESGNEFWINAGWDRRKELIMFSKDIN